VSTAGRVVLISGGNRGLGYETGRQLAAAGYRVVLGARDPAKGDAAVAALKGEGLTAETVALDITEPDSAEAAVADIMGRHGRLDVLVNNAGVRLGMGSLLNDDPAALSETLEINVVAQLRLAQLALPHMTAAGYGRIVNVSSQLGQLADPGPSQGVYRVSKAALNAVTVFLATDLGNGPIKVNSASPGWTRTDMGGEHAARSVEDGADTIVWLATLPDNGPTGGFFHDRKLIDW